MARLLPLILSAWVVAGVVLWGLPFLTGPDCGSIDREACEEFVDRLYTRPSLNLLTPVTRVVRADTETLDCGSIEYEQLYGLFTRTYVIFDCVEWISPD